MVRFSDYRAYKNPTKGMVPTLMEKEFFIADSKYYKKHSITRNDIVMFYEPSANGKILIKRVVGISNDTLSIVNGKVYINSQLAPDSYAHFEGKMHSTLSNFSPFVIPDNHIFVLGDNRNNSLDSRHFGPIDTKLTTGKPLYAYFSLLSIKRIGAKYH